MWGAVKIKICNNWRPRGTEGLTPVHQSSSIRRSLLHPLVVGNAQGEESVLAVVNNSDAEACACEAVKQFMFTTMPSKILCY
jgi:hypothetical protein